jgi:hypothetical protein
MNEYLVTINDCEYRLYADSFGLEGSQVIFYRGNQKEANFHISAVFSEYLSILRVYQNES